MKRSTLVDGRGVPLAVAVEGANVPDQKLGERHLWTPSRSSVPSLLLKSRTTSVSTRATRASRLIAKFVNAATHLTCRARPMSPPSPSTAAERPAAWKVERTHSWLNRARRLLIRWEKKASNYLGLLHFQFAIVALRAAKVSRIGSKATSARFLLSGGNRGL